MSDNAKIDSIFAIPVYSVNLADELDIQEIEKMRDKLLELLREC